MSSEPRDSKVSNLRAANLSAAWATNARLRTEALDQAASSFAERIGREIEPDAMAILRHSWSPLEPTAGVDMDQAIRHDDPLAFELIRDDGLRAKVSDLATEETVAAMFTGWHARDVIADIVEDLVAKPEDALYKVGDQWV
jgi:hypothetical protein